MEVTSIRPGHGVGDLVDCPLSPTFDLHHVVECVEGLSSSVILTWISLRAVQPSTQAASISRQEHFEVQGLQGYPESQSEMGQQMRDTDDLNDSRLE